MDEKEKILNMVAEGKISVDDAERLLSAIRESEETRQKASGELVKVSQESKRRSELYGKIIVSIQSSKGENVKIKLPLKLANFALKMIPKDKLNDIEAEGYNVREMFSRISTMVDEIDDDILNITSATGDSIRIYIEKTE